jgi:hypothetical protein
MRKWSAYVGTVLAVAGFAVALVSLALPWATFRVVADGPGDGDVDRSGGIAVFQLDQGPWYVAILLALLGLLVGAATARGRAARMAGTAAVLLAVAGMLLTGWLAEAVSAGSTATLPSVLGRVDLRTDAAPGSTYGLIAPPLLALGAALLSVRTPPTS